MTIDTSIMNDVDLPAYDDFLSRHPGALFFHSVRYRQFLMNILGRNRALYLLAKRDGKMIAVLPCFIQDLDDGRCLINSLPFYGSHGGILMAEEVQDCEAVQTALMNKLSDVAQEEQAISMTLIDNPFASTAGFYERYLRMAPTDQRIGQVTDLSVPAGANVPDALMDKFHSKTRNMVRKAEKSGFKIEIRQGLDAITELYDIHKRNMEAIGGRAKPLSVFKEIYNVFENERDYRLYFATRDGKTAAAMLVFYYKHFCEYYTPVIEAEFRSDQPLSLLIFQAMQDALKKGCTLWNWGGTWLSQDGVYLFKKRWGADDKPYNYYTCIFDRDYIEAHAPRIIDNSFFYVYPKPKVEERPAA